METLSDAHLAALQWRRTELISEVMAGNPTRPTVIQLMDTGMSFDQAYDAAHGWSQLAADTQFANAKLELEGLTFLLDVWGAL